MQSVFPKKKLAIFGIFLFILSICFYDIFFLNKTFKVSTANAQAMYYGVYGQQNNKPSFIPVNGTDASVLEEPIYQFIKNSLRQGILPLWNPHQACGYPLIGMIQIGLFFPLHFILYLLPNIIAWDLLIISRFLLGAFFTYLFMKSLGFKTVPALVSGIVFMLSGPMVLLQYWTANVNILTPLLLLCLERLVRKTKLQDLGLLSIVIALTVLAGHPEHIFLVNFYGLVFFVYRLFVYRKETSWKKVLIYYGLSYALGICMSALVMFPFVRNFFTEFWHGHPDQVGLLNEENRLRALSLILPHFFQKESLTYQFVFAGYWGGYIGLLPIGLAVISLFNNHKRGLNYFFFAMGFLILSKAYGLFYINWLGYLPFFDLVRYAIHTPHLVAFTFAVLAGMGVRTILNSEDTYKKALLYTIPVLILIGAHLAFHRVSAHYNLSVRASLFALAILIVFQVFLFLKDKKLLKPKLIPLILVVLVTAELFSYIHRERPKRYDSFAKVPYIEYLKNLPERSRSYGMFWTFYPNTGTGFGVDDFGMFLGLLPKKFVNYVHKLMTQDIFKNDLRPPALRATPMTVGTPFMDFMAVTHNITPSNDMMEKIVINFEKKNQRRPKPVYSGEVNVYKRKDAFPRSFVVHRVVFQSDKEESYKILRRMQLHLREFIVLNQKTNPAMWALMKDAPVKTESLTKITKYTPNEVVVKAIMKHPGFVVLADANHPDWRAYVNGKHAVIYEANNLARSVFLTPGTYVIRYRFQPKSFTIGVWLSLFSVLICIALINIHKFPKFKDQ